MNRLLRTSRPLIGAIGLAGSIVLGAQTAHAQIWTQAASACAIDPSSAAATTSGGVLALSASAYGTIRARCNVTNPLDAPGLAWGFFDMTYLDPDGMGATYQVTATLYRVPNATALPVVVTVLDSNTVAVTGVNTLTAAFAHAFDFLN